MAPRTVHTIGGRYKSNAAVEDAPFGEFISVRETELAFNVVHPIPEAYLRDLHSQERAAVNKHITSQLSNNNYRDSGLVEAVRRTLGTLKTVQQEMDHIPKTSSDSTTTDAPSNRTYHTAREHQESRGKHSSMHVEADTDVVSGSRSGALERSRNIDKWKSTVPPGYPPPSVSTPSSVLQSEGGSGSQSSSSSKMRKPSRHTDFLKDAKLDEKTRVIVVEHSAASHELALQEQHLASLESLALTVTSSAARRDLYGAIRKARSAVEKVRVLERKCKGALSDSRALVVDALELADDLWETSDAAADEASTVSSPTTISSRTIDSSRTTGTSPTQRSTSIAPSEPESLVPARFASPSEVVSLKQELQKIDDSLSESMRTLNRVITRSSNRAGVIKSIDRARACLDKLHVARERFSGLDDEKIRKFGAATLAIARTRHQEVLRVLDAAKQEQLRLDGPTQAKGSGGTRDTERQQPPRTEEELNQTIHRISELELADAKELLRQQKNALDQIVPHRVAEAHNGRRQMGPSLYDQFLQAGAPEAYGEPTSSVTGLPPSRYLDWDEYTCARYFESSWSWEDWE